MKRFLSRSLLFFLLSLSIAIAQANLATLTILHWNDFHSQNVPTRISKKSDDGTKKDVMVGGAAYLKAYIDKYKSESEQTLTLHAGDDFQGTPISTITRGSSQIEILNLIKPDVMAIGNHEFDYGADNLRALFPKMTFPIISANIFDNTKGATFLPQFKIEQRGSLKIGVIGLAPMDLHRLTFRENVKGLDILDAEKTTKQVIHELRKKNDCNMIIVLSHMGIEEDSSLAANVDGIDVIIGGHSHTTLRHPKRVNGVLICHAGSKGRYLGKLDLTYDLEKSKIIQSDGNLIELLNDGITPDASVAQKVAELEKQVDVALNEVIGALEVNWVRGGTRETNVGNWQADVIRDYAQADVAFQNSGGIRKNMSAGPISVRDMWEIAPFGNEFATFRVTGEQLRAMIEWQHSYAKGELCQVSGIRYVIDISRAKGSRCVQIEVGGKPVDSKREYLIATNNYISGHLYDTFGLPEKEITVEPMLPPQLDRDVFIEYVKKQKRISSKVEGRIIIKGDKEHESD